MTTTLPLERPSIEPAELEVHPLHLSVTLTHAPLNNVTNMHVLYAPDLAAGKTARAICASSEDGALVLGLSVDGDHDAVHWMPSAGADGEEMLLRGIEVLTEALKATRMAKGQNR